MCGRYALALRPSQIRQMLRDDNMPVFEAPDDPDDPDGGDGNHGGYNGPRQSYNFAPGYRGVVYRADVPDWGAGPRSQRHAGNDVDVDVDTQADAEEDEAEHAQQPSPSSVQEHDKESKSKYKSTEMEENDVHYKLQTMKWGLVPFWTKRNPGYGSVMKTINCRDDSLAQGGGMWASMKGRKRCIVVAQGFFEWLKKDGGREKIPHFVRRRDGKLMCFAGLWDVVRFEENEEKQYTYTIITTHSNKQLNFLHDRMPVILDNGSEKLRRWLDPKRYEWSKELQELLKPYEGELEVYPVSQDVGKVGNNSAAFLIPVDSKENKSNIANFFNKGAGKKKEEEIQVKKEQPEVVISKEEGLVAEDNKKDEEGTLGGDPKADGDVEEDEETKDKGIKREAEDDDLADEKPPRKKPSTATTPTTTPKKEIPRAGGGSTEKTKRKRISATSHNSKRAGKQASDAAGTQKITRFFGNSL